MAETIQDPSPSFAARTLAEAVGGRLLRDSDRPIRGGAVDSRKVAASNAFFALPGERTDGHLFLADATAKGAAALVVARDLTDDELARIDSFGTEGTERAAVVIAADPGAALLAAASAWRARFDPAVVGVTGSLAKTSTKEQVAEVLAERWTVLRNTGNENNEIGLPLTLLQLGPEHEAAVLEMGMYVGGDIAILARAARPSIGVVTAVRGTHLARAGSLDAIEAGKRELVEALPDGGTAVLNADDPRVARMADARPGLNVLRYGFDASADVNAVDVLSLGADGMRFRLRTPAGEAPVEILSLGRHSVHNALAAAAVGITVGMSLESLAAGLARPVRVPHRTVLLEAGRWLLIDDTYNAAPDSMIAALQLLASMPGRHVAVLGEMLELGGETDAAHRRVAAHAARTADVLVAVGPMAPLYAASAREAGMHAAAVHETADRQAAGKLLGEVLRRGDVVLLKASRGAELDLLVDELRNMAAAETVA